MVGVREETREEEKKNHNNKEFQVFDDVVFTSSFVVFTFSFFFSAILNGSVATKVLL